MDSAKPGSKTKGFNRRDFLELLAASGVMMALSPGEIYAADADPDELATYMIESAEKLFGIEFTEDIRENILPDLKSLLKGYLEIRKMDLNDDHPPATVFNPIPAWMQIPTEKKEPVFSEVEVATPNNIEDVAFYSIPQLAYLLQTRKITSEALTRMYLGRLKKYDPTLYFVVNLTENLAISQAKKADDEIRKGKYRGMLHGIPYGIKDLYAVKGYPTTWGVEIYKDRVIDYNASVVTKLEEAGAVLMAKLTTGRLATGEHWYGGWTRNPWNPLVGSSGSSAGPGSATAAGCVGFSIGTESNGSMTGPCHACGVSGLRPTFGRVSRYGCMTVGWSWDKVTPMCRSVEDLAIVFNAIYGPDGKDNTIIDAPFNWDTKRDISNLRIGYHKRFFDDELRGNPTDPGAIEYEMSLRNLSKTVLDHFQGLGMNIKPISIKQNYSNGLGARDNPLSGIGVSLETENAAAFDRFTRENKDALIPESNWPRHHRAHRFVPAVDLIQASRYRSLFMEHINNVLKNVDVWIEIVYGTTYTQNITGVPCVVVPCGFIYGMPAGITFVGKLFDEANLLAVAKSYQDATGHHLQHPNL